VIYSFKARDDFAATFVSGNISRLFGYEPSEYLNDLNFWREHVHPEDLPRIEADVNDLFESGQHALEYRFCRKDGSYCWVNDEQHLVRDENGESLEVVGPGATSARARPPSRRRTKRASGSASCSKARPR
jgi:adenylate cyclase